MGNAFKERRERNTNLNTKNMDNLSMASGAIGAGLGLATANWQDKRQIRQQQKLQDMQIAGSKEMGEFNQGLALETWEKTGYEAQRRQMQEAGLNVGLMYGGAGSGGTTQGGGGGQVSGGQAAGGSGELGMAIQAIQSLNLNKAQKENIEADTKNKEADAVNKGAEKTNIETETAKKKAEITNLEELKKSLKSKAAIDAIDAEIASLTKEVKIEQISNEQAKAAGEAASALAKGQVDTDTVGSRITLVNKAVEQQGLAIKAQQQGLVKGDADIKLVNQQIAKIANDVLQNERANQREWDKLSIAEKEVAIRKALQENQTKQTNFNTSTAAEIRQWTSIITDAIGAVKGMGTTKGGSETIKFEDGSSQTEYWKN